MKGTKVMKHILTILLSFSMILSLTACGGGNSGEDSGNAGSLESSADESSQTETSAVESQGQESGDAATASSEESGTVSADSTSEDDSSGAGPEKNILIAFFSHTGENNSVGVIEKGNTHIIADMIAEETGADLFEIKTVNPYPDTYDECTDVAKQEQNDNARPEIVDPPENLDGYDTIFIGYPIWWGDLPMAVYTFLENYDFSGKTVVPFCTHEGSGLSGTQSSIGQVCAGATVLDGLAIRGSVAQNEREEAEAAVLEWLDDLEIQ